ncbi:MAG: hypothetical protein E7487_05835 [Ruminococcaceae bacterium]|nr:hypothetical protein [Oscillospiraceae bacterium]
MKKVFSRIITGVVTLLLMISFSACHTNESIEENKQEVDLKGNRPEDFTIEDYNILTPEEKALFPDYFENMDAYLEWYDRVVEGLVLPEVEADLLEIEPDIPAEKIEVDLKGKNPEDFTKGDYDSLTPEEKALFPDYFESMDAYLEWYDRVVSQQ